jgi:hypothetical protein
MCVNFATKQAFVEVFFKQTKLFVEIFQQNKFGNRPVMPLMTRDKTGTIREKQGQVGTKHGQAGTKQGQQGQNRDSRNKQEYNR